ncbi:serine/threonine-protein kinase grp [Schistocerca cancellata]|uniref:serine/threonine-protein kinase grp n=1 Tax=Schistocerca cancellata TaxID=274614 RepID=UPI0021194651|nr:serine/threonine-protein kinase grp [Schistocerca cancellata]XP_049763821.1 serine/threonine-protein kinase grp [Schistocerca cancellata]
MVSEFVDGWSIAQTLGEGAYGEVKLLVNQSTGEAVAMKVVDVDKHPDARSNIKKEICIHRMMSDPHIIRFFGQRREGNLEYLFLEYAAGGELFDRIEPDHGMNAWEAQKYFKQLIAGVEYLHSRGVTHRDLKPENLLLDEHDNLKISDFGMATVYRMQGKERCLEKRCGTLPYVAPEVMVRPYHAEPADIWSCGIILVAMLAGELPWDQPTADCVEYMAWKDGKWAHLTPWVKLENMALSLVRRILVPMPSGRYTLKQIVSHRWCQKNFMKMPESYHSNEATPNATSKRICSGGDLSPLNGTCDISGAARLCHSQPEPRLERECPDQGPLVQHDIPFSFSQPAHLEDLLLSSQLNPTQSSGTQNPFQKLVRRMTRFFVTTNCEDSLRRLCDLLDKIGFSWKIATTRVVTITTVDKRKMQLVFKANVMVMDGNTLLDFRLSKGCGLEFKKTFIKLKECLEDIIIKGPVMWPIAIATNTVP